MSINSLGRQKVAGKGLKSLKKSKTKSRSVAGEVKISSRATLNGAAIIIAGACLLAPDYSFAENNSSDLAAEVERLRKELGETKKENEQLKKAVANGNAGTAGNAAQAQPAPATVATAEPPKKEKKSFNDEPKNLSEVVVTSRRKEEKLQEVPIPIAVISGEQMRRDNIVTVQDFSRRVPNLGVTSTNVRQTSIALRGLGKNSGNESMEASVGVMVDNVWSSWVGSTWSNYVDIDHVEVLRGPQGTLQGKNSNLGLINVNTKLPSFKSGYSIDGFAGNRDSLQGKASATGPIIDGLLAYRASLYIDKRDGMVTNFDSPITVGKLQETNAMGGRIQFLLTPTDNLSARIIADRSKATQTMSVNPLIEDPARFADGTVRPTTFSSRLSRNWFDSIRNSGQPLTVIGDPRKMAVDNHEVSRGDQQGASGEINWDVAGHKLTSISAYRYSLFEPHHDGDNSTADIQQISGWTVQNRQWSQEFRIASLKPAFNFIDYQAGVFGMRSSADVQNHRRYGADAGAFYASNAIYNRLNATASGREIMQKSLNRVLQTGYRNPEVTSLAGYGQVNLHFTDKATLTLGLRHTWEDRDNIGSDGFVGGENLDTLAGATASQIADAKAIRSAAVGNVWEAGRQGFQASSQNWLVNPSYKINKDLMVYFSTAGGQKSGAAQFSNTGAVENVDPENVMDYELGVKSTWFDRKLAVNVNLYNTDVEGFQSQLVIPDSATATGTRTTLGNIKGIQLRGVELETNWQATQGLNFFLNGSFNHAVYTDFKNAPCPAEANSSQPCDQTGLQIPNAPMFTANYGIDYRVPLGFGKWNDHGLEWHAFLVDSYKSKANFNANLSSSGVQQAYHVTDGGIGIGTKNGQYSLNLVGRNIFDTIYLTNAGQYSSTSAASGTYGDGRYYGAHFRANF
ncbi:TonB-dependent receptor [Methylobacter sp.]|uniref:TonB-dependent receptor domain-containing protein n=1 Tax=Methylobacter sp. TaxID=2051955 RepID=UPI00120227EB|nr:TonB-dependent receptor [Methylobacter sp.]TAK64956.1 MAG: TonB-dependent receptor [Methylobacter sp.]